MYDRDFEHGFVVQSSQLPSDWSAFTASRMSEVLSGNFHDIVTAVDTSLRNLDGGGWEVVSHDTLIANGVLVVNFLIKRERHGS